MAFAQTTFGYVYGAISSPVINYDDFEILIGLVQNGSIVSAIHSAALCAGITTLTSGIVVLPTPEIYRGVFQHSLWPFVYPSSPIFGARADATLFL